MNSRLPFGPPKQTLAQRSGRLDVADRRALRIEDAHAVELRRAHAPAAPQIAVLVDAEAVRRLFLGALDQHLAVRKLRPVHVEHVDRALQRLALDHVELLLVGRKREPVRPLDQPVRHHRRLPALAVDPVDPLRQFLLAGLAVPVAVDARGHVGEPDRVVGLHHHVVGRAQPLAFEAVAQHGDAAVIFGAGDAPAVLGGDQPALAVAGVAVGVVRGLPIDAGRAGPLVPAHDAVVGDVAPQQAPRIAEPDRPLRPRIALRQPLDARQQHAVFLEALVEDLHRRDRAGVRSGPAARWSSGTSSPPCIFRRGA